MKKEKLKTKDVKNITQEKRKPQNGNKILNGSNDRSNTSKAAASAKRMRAEDSDLNEAWEEFKRETGYKERKRSIQKSGMNQKEIHHKPNTINRKDNKKLIAIDPKNKEEKGNASTRKSIDQKKDFNRKNRTGNNTLDHNNRSRIGNSGCPFLKECGGCNILRESYEIHLSKKQKLVEALLKSHCKVDPIIGMKQPNHYRNKVHVVFDRDRKGNPVSGVYEEGTHRVIPVETCLIHNQKADAIIATIRGMLKSFKILTYDEDTEYGLLRHVLIRTGFHSGEIMVVLVLASPILPSKNNFVKALLKHHPEITTVVINVNNKRTSMVLGDKEHVIHGKGFIEDSLCSKTFRISPKSFYQVNPLQTEVIYGKAIELAGLSGKETVVDAYCGIGTIGIIASDKASKVIGVELNKDAVRDAVTNAKLNAIKNIEFYQNDAGVFMNRMAERKETVDVVLMDPPRSGSSEQFLNAIAVLKPKRVVYISCNPVTLERDLQYLTKKGYKAEKAVPVDMFPWTEHVETVILMTRCGKNDK